MTRRFVSCSSLLLALVAGSTLLTGCMVPLMVGGAAVSGVMMANDRRTTGAQVEDQLIESKAARQVKAVLGDKGHVNVNSYNRVLLLTGEVPTEEERVAIEKAVAGIDNLRSVVNESAVMLASSLTARSNDVLVNSKVRATLIDAGDLPSQAFKLVVERGTVFLMGRVTTAEVDRATALARAVSGVQKVVRVVELISEDELKALKANAPKPEPASPGPR
jgi:osmotically-inducible protein OsmY